MTEKRFQIIVAIAMAAATVLTVLLMAFPGALGGSAAALDYESSLFSSVMEVEITVDEQAWAELLENAMEEEYIACDITIHGKTYPSVGIRAKGNSSLSTLVNSESNRYSFKLEFDHYVTGQTLDGLDKLALNNNYADATCMKEYLSYQMFSSMGVATPLCTYANVTVNGEAWGLYLAVECIEESFAQRNYGSNYGQLYKPETMDMGGGKEFAEGMGQMQLPGKMELPEGAQLPEGMESAGGMEPFGNMQPPGQQTEAGDDPAQQQPQAPAQGAEGNLPGNFPDRTNRGEEGGRGGGSMGGAGTDLAYTDDELTSYSGIFDNAVFSTNTAADQRRVVEALQALNAGESLEESIDVDRVLRYFAVNTVLVNLDHYTGSLQHNYYLYEQDGILSMVPWDYNMAFAGYESMSAEDAVNFPIDTPVSGCELADRPMLAKLLENEAYREQYHQYIDQIVTQWFEGGLLEQTIDRLDAMIGDLVAQDPTSFVTKQEYTAGVEALKLFIDLRGESLRGQLNGSIPSTDEGQQASPETLVDASGLSISQMGGMNMGGFSRNSSRQQPGGKMDQDTAPGGADAAEDGLIPEAQDN